MTERERFEQWCQMPPREWDVSRWPDDDGTLGGVYRHPVTRDSWIVWQAATDAAKTETIWEGDLNELSRLGKEMGEYDAEKDD